MSDTADQSSIIVIDTVAPQTPEDVATVLHIPVIAEIEPRTDPIYGHTFKWPEEVAQFFILSSMGEGRGEGDSHA